MTTNQAIGHILRATRKESGRTTAAAGAALGVAPGTVLSWERGERTLDIIQFVTLITFYEASPRATMRLIEDLDHTSVTHKE